MERTLALLAFDNPEESPFGDLLNMMQRQKVRRAPRVGAVVGVPLGLRARPGGRGVAGSRLGTWPCGTTASALPSCPLSHDVPLGTAQSCDFLRALTLGRRGVSVTCHA